MVLLLLLLLFLFFWGKREMSGEGMKDAANNPRWNQTKFAARKTAEKPEDEDEQRHEEQRQKDGQQTSQWIRHRDGLGDGLIMHKDCGGRSRRLIRWFHGKMCYLNFAVSLQRLTHCFTSNIVMKMELILIAWAKMRVLIWYQFVFRNRHNRRLKVFPG